MILSNLLQIAQNKEKIKAQLHKLNEGYQAPLFKKWQRWLDDNKVGFKYCPTTSQQKLAGSLAPDIYFYVDSDYVCSHDWFELAYGYSKLFENLRPSPKYNIVNTYEFRYDFQGCPEYMPEIKVNGYDVKRLTMQHILNHTVMDQVYAMKKEENPGLFKFSEIDGSHIESVQVEDAKKNRYKEYLLIWERPDGSLLAITYNNKVLVYFKEDSKHFIFVNKDLEPDADISELYNGDIDKITEWLKKAYIFRPYYHFYTGKEAVKKTNLASTSVNHILSLFEFDEKPVIYGIKLEAVEAARQSEDEANARKDWHRFETDVKNQVMLNAQRYKKLKQKHAVSKEFHVLDSQLGVIINTTEKFIQSIFDDIHKIFTDNLKDIQDQLTQVYVYNSWNACLYELCEELLSISNFAVNAMNKLGRVSEPDEQINPTSYSLLMRDIVDNLDSINRHIGYALVYNNNSPFWEERIQKNLKLLDILAGVNETDYNQMVETIDDMQISKTSIDSLTKVSNFY